MQAAHPAEQEPHCELEVGLHGVTTKEVEQGSQGEHSAALLVVEYEAELHGVHSVSAASKQALLTYFPGVQVLQVRQVPEELSWK